MTAAPDPSENADPSALPKPAEPAERSVGYEHSAGWVPLLEQLGCSLLVSTYQAGKVLAVGARGGALSLSFHNFDRPMGLAAGGAGVLAVGSRTCVWFLTSAPDLAPRLQPPGTYDACYLARRAHYTGEIQVHELAWGAAGGGGGELWAVNTLFSCLCTIGGDFSFAPRWKPPFVTALAAEDRCHLNGLAMGPDGQPAFVTAMAETDTRQGWRPTKASSGVVIHVPSGRVVARGLAMPHSPRLHAGRLWVLDSGAGRLLAVEPDTGRAAVVAEVPGYTRGMAILHSPAHGSVAFVGLSRIRETSVFGGVPIAERRDELRCGVAAVHLESGRQLAYLRFTSGVEEVFAVEVLAGVRGPALYGPHADADGAPVLWHVPPLPVPAPRPTSLTRGPETGNG